MFRALKSEFLAYFDVQDWTMHLTLGLAFFAVSVAVTRRPWFSFWMLVCVQLANEVIDLSEQSWPPSAAKELVSDTLWTISLPFVAAGCLAAILVVADAVRNR